jgi:CHAT domain-containing protein
MEQRTYRLRGSVAEEPLSPATETADVTITTRKRLIPGRARDGATAEYVAHDDEVVRVELENGFVLWSRVDDLVREHGRQVLSRDGTEAWEFGSIAPARGGERSERGLFGLAIKVLDFFGIEAKKKVAGELGEALESKLLRGNTPGLYRCSLDQSVTSKQALALVPVGEAAIPADQGPMLLLLHGTASSCTGSFGKLWDEKNIEGRTARERLRSVYQDRVFAFEHLSLTESPITNAVALVERLPDHAELHLVSHSRGGLVGELLCLGSCANLDDVLAPDRLQELFAADRTIADQLGLSPLDTAAAQKRNSAYDADREKLSRLLDLLKQRQFRIRRFVRVACPARGTTLASGRLDRWLSMVSFLAEKATGIGLFGDGLDFLVGVVKERTDPRTLPGLEAMMPGSALTRLLNSGELQTAADVTVISGDIEGDSFWQKLKVMVTDWFYGADHDLVVNTGSMYGGLRRTPTGARYRRNAGADVNHFSYFAQTASIRWLVSGLTRADGDDAGFLPLETAQQEPPRWRGAVARSRAAGGTPRPVALVLPGTMGTHLRVGERQVWLRYLSLLRGGLKHLRHESRDVAVDGPIDDFYGPILEFLARTHRVEIFGYDWRLSVRDAASKLALQLEDLLPRAERERQPVHLVAHSMGGLVLRAMIAGGGTGAALWERVTRLPNSRLLMLGTPNHGSYEAVRWLTGLNPTLTKLSLLDFTQGAEDIVDIVRRYPGLCELLPFGEGDTDFSDPGRWAELQRKTEGRWSPAPKETLSEAATTWQLLRAAPVDSRFVCYVAGVQPSTVAGYQVADYDAPSTSRRQRLVFEATQAGDGTVTWASGKLPGVTMWYAENTAHDALCAKPGMFPAYLDLLQNGDTARLPKSPPGRRRDASTADERFLLPATPPTDGIPGEVDLRTFGFGGGVTGPEGRESPSLPTIEVSIVHGDLSYVRHSVLVGHYTGDTIVSAEAVVDRQLQGALRQRLELGVYPGPLGTHAVFLNPEPLSKPPGAIVVGLGQVGELTPGLLEAGVRAALIDYALQVARWPDDRFGKPGSPRRASVSCLLVGTGAGGIPIRDSMDAILRGAVAANARLVRSHLEQLVTIDRLQFIEMYEDVAIGAAEQLKRVLTDGELAKAVRWTADGLVETGQAGRRRVQFDDATEWWQRMEIVEDPDRPDILRFVASTDRARSEQTMSTGQLALAEQFIRETSASTAHNAEAARTLFELLLPLRLKELAPQADDLVLLLDARSARYPWELLEDRWSDHGRPPAVRSGLVRQLKTTNFRARPAHSFGNTALVIGNPDLAGWDAFADLPGARSEGQKVAALLTANGYDVHDCIDEKTAQIVQGLHRSAWRVLHLAGHGEHEFPVTSSDGKGTELKSGLVIGKNTFLTPGDIEQMRWVPELVFINCCHLGKTQSTRSVDYGVLAANLGVKFVEMGVRAVVTAGWAVDDEAAVTFADTFYRRMLDGQTFGDAVRAARKEVWMRFRSVNTWGAYQCYGDPDFRLHRNQRSSNSAAPRPYSAPVELVTDLDNLTSALKAGSRESGPDAHAAKQIDTFLQRIPESQRMPWHARADVCAALGFAWGEARHWTEAIDALDRALEAAKGDCPIRVVEQSANFKVRRAASEWQQVRASALPGDALEARRMAHVKTIESALFELDLLCRRARTAERLNLMGSACKRLAFVLGPSQRREEALLNMANYYQQAHTLGSETYSYTNWACAQILAAHCNPALRATLPTELDAQLNEIRARQERALESDPDFWGSVSIPDIELVRLLACILPFRTEPISEAQLRLLVDDIIARYRTVFWRAASARERSSVEEHLQFLREVGAQDERLRTALERILEEIV